MPPRAPRSTPTTLPGLKPAVRSKGYWTATRAPRYSLLFALPLLLLSAALMYLDRRAARAADLNESAGGHAARVAPGSRAVTLVAVLAVIAGVAAGVQVYRVGDSGARAAWGDQVSSGR